MSGHHGFRKNNKRNFNKNVQNKPQLDENSVIQKSFREYSLQLDDKHDRYERIIKLSRDITIESKRIIFLLHSIEERKNNREKNFQEAATRLQKLMDVNFKAIAKELDGHDVYQYRGAYSPGLQEFIEAYTFLEYLKHEKDSNQTLSDWKALQDKMEYIETIPKEKDDGVEVAEENPAISDAVEEKDSKPNNEQKKFKFFICPHEYILGLSDLTGELMRHCINALGSGEADTCIDTCNVLKNFYTGYISINAFRARELHRKINTMRQSVLKVENVCYNVKVRGGEAAVWGSVLDTKHDDYVDEGFF